MSKQLLYQGQPGTSSAVAVTTSSAVRAIDAATVVNPTGADAWLSVWLVQDGDSAVDANILYHEMAVVANGVPVSLSQLLNHALPAGATIHLQAETATALTVHISGKS